MTNDSRLMLSFRHKIILSSLFSLLSAWCHPQVFNNLEWFDNDSLLPILPGQQGVERVKTLNHLASSLSYEDFDKSIGFAREAHDLADELDDEEGLAHAERNLGHAFYYDGNYPEALNHYWEALNRFEALKNYKLVALVYKDIATTHLFGNNLEKAKEVCFDAIHTLRLKDDEGRTIGSATDTMRLYSGLGLALRISNRSDSALQIYRSYLDIGEKNGFEITDMLVHHGLVAGCYIETGKPDSALMFFRKALAFPEVNPSVTAMNWEHRRRIGQTYHLLQQPDSAKYYLRLAHSWFSINGFLRQAQLAATELGEICLEEHDPASAEHYFLAAEDLLEEMRITDSYYRYDSLKYVVSYGSELYIPFTKKNYKETRLHLGIRTYHHLYKFYLNRNDLSKALIYLEKYAEAKDTLNILTRQKESIEIQTRYETDAKESQIATLTQQNLLKEIRLKQTRWFIFGLAGLVIIISLLAIILIRQNRLKHDQQTLILQQKLLRSQMNPHFLFNSLSSIQNYIIKEKPVLASDYLSRFSKLVRHILDNSNKEFISLEEELDTIENYLAIQKVRYGELFDYKISVDEAIDPESVQIPPMLAQPFLENSIEHGFKSKGSKGHLMVTYTLEENTIRLVIEDDGIGREKAMEILQQANKRHESLATNITRERLMALNRKSRNKITFEVNDLVDIAGQGCGTKVSMNIPLDLTLS